MSVTPEVEIEILAEFNKNPQRFSPFRTSKVLGVPITDVLQIIEDNKETTSRRAETYGGLGRPELQPYIVGRRKAMASGWKNEAPEIAQARSNMEKGTHILTTGRDGPWLLLYSIPRKGKPEPQPDYFDMETA